MYNDLCATTRETTADTVPALPFKQSPQSCNKVCAVLMILRTHGLVESRERSKGSHQRGWRGGFDDTPFDRCVTKYSGRCVLAQASPSESKHMALLDLLVNL